MDLSALCDRVRGAERVVAVGSRTQWEVGGPPPRGTEVMAPSGILAHDPADLTVTVGAGTRVADLAVVLAEHGQECPLDPRHPQATVGGVLACGLSGHRRLRWGPVRDRVLEVRFVTADGRVVKGGGPTVKNVSGYDVPRLLVGSLGTLGVLVQVTLRCQPMPKASVWAVGTGDPFALREGLFRPSCLAWDGERVWVLLEGHPADVEAEIRGAGLARAEAPPPWPDGAVRGRVAVRPGELRSLGRALDDVAGLSWMAEVGVGTVHVAASEAGPVERAREATAARGGWMLREAGEDLAPFGCHLPNAAVMRRIKQALDPSGKLNPGRLPL